MREVVKKRGLAEALGPRHAAAVALAHLAHQLRRAVLREKALGVASAALGGAGVPPAEPVHEQHAPHDVRGRHALRPRDGAVLAHLPGALVHVLAVHDAGVVAVHHVVDLVLLDDPLQVLLVHDVRAVGDHLVHELAPFHHRHALLVRAHRRPLAGLDGAVGVHAHHEVRAQAAAAAEGVHVPVVHQVEGPVHEDAHRLLPLVVGVTVQLGLRQLQLQRAHQLHGLSKLLLKPLSAAPMPFAKETVIANQRGKDRTNADKYLLSIRVRFWNHEVGKHHMNPIHKLSHRLTL